MNASDSRTVNANRVLILACSGAADVGAIADMAARKIARNGAGKMHCLAGIGGKVPAIMSNILSTSRILAIDGCGKNCARETLTKAGFLLSYHLCLADLGMEKGSTPVTVEVIEEAAAKAIELLEI